MKYIVALSNKKFVLIAVDDVDYVDLHKYSWSIQHSTNDKEYAIARINGEPILTHRYIMQAKAGEDVDHIDNDGLNNCRINLRLATRSQNHANRVKLSGCSSEYKGVSWDSNRQKWHVMIGVGKQKKLNLGRYDDELEAARVYDEKARELFGEFAKVNFP